MTARATARPLMCLLLVLSLWAPMVAIATAGEDRNCATEFRTLAAPSSSVLLTRAGARHDQARQRLSAPALFTLVELRCGGSDPGSVAAAVRPRLVRSLWTAGLRAGRSPPAIS